MTISKETSDLIVKALGQSEKIKALAEGWAGDHRWMLKASIQDFPLFQDAALNLASKAFRLGAGNRPFRKKQVRIEKRTQSNTIR